MKSLFKIGITGVLAVSMLCVGSAYCGAAQKKKTPVKPAPTAPAAKRAPKVQSAPVQVKWEVKNAEKATFEIPSNWKQDKTAPDRVNAWYIGSNTAAPEGAFVILWEDVQLDHITGLESAKKVGAVQVAGVAATEYAVTENESDFEGMAIVGDQPGADGRRMIIIAGSANGNWKKHEATLRKVVASIKLKDKADAAK